VCCDCGGSVTLAVEPKFPFGAMPCPPGWMDADGLTNDEYDDGYTEAEREFGRTHLPDPPLVEGAMTETAPMREPTTPMEETP